MQLGGRHAATPPSAAPARGRAGGPLWRLPPRGANPGRARRAPGPMLEADGREFSERWGYLSRAGLNDKSCLTRQIEKYADIYTSRVSNFLQYTCGPPASRARLPRSARHPFNLGGMGNPLCAVHMLRILDRARYSSCSLCIRQRSKGVPAGCGDSSARIAASMHPRAAGAQAVHVLPLPLPERGARLPPRRGRRRRGLRGSARGRARRASPCAGERGRPQDCRSCGAAAGGPHMSIEALRFSSVLSCPCVLWVSAAGRSCHTGGWQSRSCRTFYCSANCCCCCL